MKPVKTLLFSAALILAGCVSQQVTSQQAGGGAVGIVAAHPSGPQTISKTVAMGKTINFIHAITVNPDCTSGGLSTVRITQAPVHGKAVIVQRDGYPSFPTTNQNFSCNKIKVPGTFVDYTPEDGFTGSDFMTVEIISVTGNDTVWKIDITVK